MARIVQRGAIAAAVVATAWGGAAMMAPRPHVASAEPSPPPPETPLPQPAKTFDGANAFRYLTALCDLGPRLTASPAMARQRTLLAAHFRALGATVEEQVFEARQPSLAKPFECVNLIVKWRPERTRRVLLGVHYDTRPMADREPPFSQQRGKFLGANDGGSGTALLMELGRLMPNLPTAVGVDFVFFDAEEYLFDTLRDKYFIGSEHFVRQLQKPGAKPYDAALILDMVGGKDLFICPEGRCQRERTELVAEVWGIARQLGIPEFNQQVRHEVQDDHKPFLDAGMNAIVLIDFDYAHWHRLTDVPANCSGASLTKTARVVSAWLKQRK